MYHRHLYKCLWHEVTVNTSHYGKEESFELPKGWEWCSINIIADSILYGVSESAKTKGKYKLLRITDIQNGNVDWPTVPLTDYDESRVSQYLLRDNDVLFARTGATVGKSYLSSNTPDFAIFASYLIRVRFNRHISPQYAKCFFESDYYWEQIKNYSIGVGQPNVNGSVLGGLKIPIPPRKEQDRIVVEVSSILETIDIIIQERNATAKVISRIRDKILDYAFRGKLVPQDSNEEPAINILKHINPAFKPSYNLHYEGVLPVGWVICRLEDILDYEQPQAYIVKSTEYSDSYCTPVLTPGKSFILGYTNESNGICNTLPVIIFDDFTTESKYVDFPFKVKSSAMKILRTKGDIDIRYVAFFMSTTKLAGDTHKRYWISEYSKMCIPLPPVEEQRRIVAAITNINKQLELLIADTL